MTNDVSITITLSAIFLQMLLKLAESTAVTVAGMYCMKVIRNFRNKISASGERTPAREITILLTSKQRKLINEATSQHNTSQPFNEENEGIIISGGPSITVELTKRQRRQVKEATGQYPSKLRVGVVKSGRNHEWIKAVFDRSGWVTTLQEESAMSVWQFVERWASTLLLLIYLGVKMYLNVKHWIFNT
jgi:hypothetical protein